MISAKNLKNRTGEINCKYKYLTSIGHTVGNCSNLGNGALLIINGYADLVCKSAVFIRSKVALEKCLHF